MEARFPYGEVAALLWMASLRRTPAPYAINRDFDDSVEQISALCGTAQEGDRGWGPYLMGNREKWVYRIEILKEVTCQLVKWHTGRGSTGSEVRR